MKIAISVPVRDTVHASFAYCLANLTAQLIRNNIDYTLNFDHGSVIAGQRNNLVSNAIETKASHILWLDSDMHFPSSIVSSLLRHEKDIVACTYSTRYSPKRSVAFTDRMDLDQRLDKKFGLNEVFAVGMGCMLTKTSVFEKLPKPWFQYIWNEDREDLSGEDIYFCSQAIDYGYTVFVDSTVSNKVAHLGTKAFLINETNEFN
jgi:hypothetical protein